MMLSSTVTSSGTFHKHCYMLVELQLKGVKQKAKIICKPLKEERSEILKLTYVG